MFFDLFMWMVVYIYINKKEVSMVNKILFLIIIKYNKIFIYELYMRFVC